MNSGQVFTYAKSGRSVPVAVDARPSEAAIEDGAQRLVGSFAHQPRIVIRESAADVIPGITERGVASGAVHKGAIYLFMDTLGSQAEVARALFHELFHYGLNPFEFRAGIYLALLLAEA